MACLTVATLSVRAIMVAFSDYWEQKQNNIILSKTPISRDTSR